VKVYTEIFKHYHREKPKPFEKSEISSFLKKNLYFQSKNFVQQTNDYKRLFETLRELCQLENCSSYGRIEVIVSSGALPSNTRIETNEVILEKIILQARTVFDLCANSTCLFAISNQDLYDHLQFYLVSAVNTIQNAVENVIAGRNLTEGT